MQKLFNDPPKVIVSILQGSNEWHRQRKYRITGSRIYDIFTYSKNEWNMKAIKYFFAKSFSNKFVKHGITYESDARETFIAETSSTVIECGMVVSQSNPWLGYSPDGVIFENNIPIALIEIQCLFEGAKKTISEVLPKTTFLEKSNGRYQLKKKHKYYGQIQLGMTILNLPICYLVLYSSFDKSIEIISVEFNYEFAKNLLIIVKQNFFLKRCFIQFVLQIKYV